MRSISLGTYRRKTGATRMSRRL